MHSNYLLEDIWHWMIVQHQEPVVGRGEVFPFARSVKFETICRLKMSKTANFDTLSINTFYVYILCIMVGSYSQRGGGECPLPPSPKCTPGSWGCWALGIRSAFIWCKWLGWVIHMCWQSREDPDWNSIQDATPFYPDVYSGMCEVLCYNHIVCLFVTHSLPKCSVSLDSGIPISMWREKCV